MALAVLYRAEPKECDFGPGHSFRGDRYEVFPQFLKDERFCRYQDYHGRSKSNPTEIYKGSIL